MRFRLTALQGGYLEFSMTRLGFDRGLQISLDNVGLELVQ